MKQATLALALMALTTTSMADMDILHDSGRTKPSSAYLESLKSGPVERKRPSVAKMAMPHTPEMSLGRVQPRKVKLDYLPSPMFLIGADQTSLRWLSNHKASLKKAGAVGLIVNADSHQQLQKAIQVTQGLQVSPASGSDLAKQFKLRHYPVLITKKQIAQ